jgi:hypothetical protein
LLLLSTAKNEICQEEFYVFLIFLKNSKRKTRDSKLREFNHQPHEHYELDQKQRNFLFFVREVRVVRGF